MKKFFIKTPLADLDSAEAKLTDYGISLYQNEEKILVSTVKFASKAAKDGLEMDFEIISISKAQEQPSKFIVYIFAIIVLILVYYVQNKRKKLKVNYV